MQEVSSEEISKSETSNEETSNNSDKIIINISKNSECENLMRNESFHFQNDEIGEEY
jgi:hypothetical protein